MELSPTDWIQDAWWSYFVIAAVINGSAIFPPLPSEGMLVSAMTLALSGELDPVLVAVATTAGAMGGDLTAYGIGRWAGRRRRHGGTAPGKVEQALEWLEEREQEWGPGLIVVGRFIPGGTTVVGLAAGTLRYPLWRFVTFSAIGASIWTGYGYGISRVGRAAAPGSPWLSIVVALVVVLLLAGGLQLLDRRKKRRAARSAQDAPGER